MTTSRPLYKIKPYAWQLQATEEAKKKRDYALLAEMGTGKSSAMIHILRHKFSLQKQIRRTLICSPLVTLYNWKDEFIKHSYIDPNFVIPLSMGGGIRKLDYFVNLVKNEKDKLEKPFIFIINYEALVACPQLYQAIYDWQPEILVCDESQMLKTPSSKRTKLIKGIADRTDHNYILSGSPILNNIYDVFSQYRILDRGETFGTNAAVFKHTYMYDENASWSSKSSYFPKWVPRPEKYEELTNKIYTKAIRVLKKDCLDLPDLIKKFVYVELGSEQKKAYESMKKDFVAFIEQKRGDSTLSGAVVAQLAITKALRLMQMVTGYAALEDGTEIAFKNNPRLEATKQLLEALHENHKIIIWCSFRKNYEMLSKLCNDLKINHVMLTGEQSLEEKKQSMDSFNNKEQCRVIIANRAAGGIGINLVAADYSIIYSRNFSLGEELQSEARNHRGGSEIHEKIVQINLCAKNTIDEHVISALQNKKNVSDSIIDFIGV